jgi:hypothetical protein
MSSDVFRPSSIAAANVLGGVGAPRARLLDRVNLCPYFNFNVGTGAWAAGGTGTILQRPFDPTNIFGRYTLGIADSGTSGTRGYGEILCDSGVPLTGEMFAVIVSAKAVGANTNFEVELRENDGTPEILASGTLAFTQDEWNHVVFISTFATATAEDFYLRFYPAAGAAADTGTVRIAMPRVHHVWEVLTSIPALPFMSWRFDPILRIPASSNVYGQLAVSKRGFRPSFSADYALLDGDAQLKDLGKMVHHDGHILLEPNQDASFIFLMTTRDEPWDFPRVDGRALGHQGRLALHGVDPIFAIPDATIYYGEESRYYAAVPRYHIVAS